MAVQTDTMMKVKVSTPRIVRFALALALGALAYTAACQNITSVRGQTFVIQVDSVSGPTAVSGGAKFSIYFWGTVGPNGCYSFKEFKTTRTSSALDVTLYGRNIDGAGYACPQSVTRLSGLPFEVTPPVSDPFIVTVHQADNSVLTRTIRAE